MMGMHSIKMKTSVDRLKLLETLKSNLTQHSEIVKEAREGYVKQASREVEKRLEQLRRGKVVSLTFSLSVPRDYSEVYKSAIAMLEWNTADYVDLSADEFRQLVEDKWDWRVDFLQTNKSYSVTASKMSEEEDE